MPADQYSVKEFFCRLLSEVLSVDGGLSLVKTSGKTTTLKNSIVSTNTNILGVSSANGVLSLTPVSTTVYAAQSSNEAVLTTRIIDGLLQLILSNNIVTSVYSEDPDTVVSIANNRLSFVKSGGFPRTDLSINQTITINNGTYGVSVAQ